MRVSMIVAMDCNGLIGNGSAMPWHLPADLKRFRKLTTGRPIVMGRKTLESIGRALPDRVNIVLTRQSGWTHEGVEVVDSVERALAMAGDAAKRLGVDEMFVIGGAEVYSAMLPHVQRLYLTIVEGEFTGDVYLPNGMLERFTTTIGEVENCKADDRNRHDHQFMVRARA